MIALYTETFEEFLKRNEETTEWQAIKTSFGGFPNFTLGSLNINMYDLFKDTYEIREIGGETESLFYHFIKDKLNELKIKYVPKITTYIANFNKLLDRKISLDKDSTLTKTGTIDIDNTLAKTGTIDIDNTLTKDGTITDEGDGITNGLLYPANQITGVTYGTSATGDKFENSNTRDIDTTDTIDETKTFNTSDTIDETKTFNTSDTIDETKEQAFMIFESNPKIMKAFLEIKDIYWDCVQGFEPCFMGIY